MKELFVEIYSFLKIFGTVLSLFFFLGIIYFLFKRSELSRKEEERWNEHFQRGRLNDEEEFDDFDRLRKLFLSPSENDWKMAIIHIDEILERCLDGYFSIEDREAPFGEKLKRFSVRDYPFLADVWDIHKLRNTIAHDRNFQLSQDLALSILGKAERILQYLSC